jgi:hypothetical protein
MGKYHLGAGSTLQRTIALGRYLSVMMGHNRKRCRLSYIVKTADFCLAERDKKPSISGLLLPTELVTRNPLRGTTPVISAAVDLKLLLHIYRRRLEIDDKLYETRNVVSCPGRNAERIQIMLVTFISLLALLGGVQSFLKMYQKNVKPMLSKLNRKLHRVLLAIPWW